VRRALAVVAAGAALFAACALCVACALPPAAPAAAIDAPVGPPGDPARGRALIIARDPANCVLCHAVPDPELPVAGDLGPTLAGVGARLSPGAIRLRIVDASRAHPGSIMPRYFSAAGLVDVAAPYRGLAILDAQQVEDLVAYLGTLR